MSAPHGVSVYVHNWGGCWTKKWRERNELTIRDLQRSPGAVLIAQETHTPWMVPLEAVFSLAYCPCGWLCVGVKKDLGSVRLLDHRCGRDKPHAKDTATSHLAAFEVQLLNVASDLPVCPFTLVNIHLHHKTAWACRGWYAAFHRRMDDLRDLVYKCMVDLVGGGFNQSADRIAEQLDLLGGTAWMRLAGGQPWTSSKDDDGDCLRLFAPRGRFRTAREVQPKRDLFDAGKILGKGSHWPLICYLDWKRGTSSRKTPQAKTKARKRRREMQRARSSGA